MKVQRIHVQNIKAIAHQELNLNGATAIVMGGNNKGKSTLLRSLKDRLLKLKADHLIRAGESNGLYEMFFTDGSVISWELSNKTAKGEKLTLTTTDGNKTSVITDIIKWFAPNNFDIDKFLNESPAAQRKTLERLLGIDMSNLDAEYLKAVEERKDANRDVERIEVNYKGKEVDEWVGEAVLPTEELEKELLGVETHNDKYNIKLQESKSILEKIGDLQEEIDRLHYKLDPLTVELQRPEIQPKSDEYVGQLKKKLESIQVENQLIQENNRLRTALRELTHLKEIAHEKDMKVKDILAKKDALIQSAKMPEGFGFSEDGITYQGLPLTREQLSSSAIYIAALKLASINVGNVRMLHFDASFLDKNSLADVLKWAESEDMQLCIEKPDFEAGEISYEIIEDNWLNS